MADKDLVWHKVMARDALAEGRVMPVTCAHMTLCMTHHQGQISALDNKCPHQGGPRGMRVEKKAELDGALQQALEYDGPSLVEIISDVELI